MVHHRLCIFRTETTLGSHVRSDPLSSWHEWLSKLSRRLINLCQTRIRNNLANESESVNLLKTRGCSLQVRWTPSMNFRFLENFLGNQSNRNLRLLFSKHQEKQPSKGSFTFLAGPLPSVDPIFTLPTSPFLNPQRTVGRRRRMKGY